MQSVFLMDIVLCRFSIHSVSFGNLYLFKKLVDFIQTIKLHEIKILKISSFTSIMSVDTTVISLFFIPIIFSLFLKIGI